jgi:Leucine-rich repeat (LRR) protein
MSICYFPDTLRISKTLVSSSLSPDIGNLTEMSKLRCEHCRRYIIVMKILTYHNFYRLWGTLAFFDVSNNFIRATIPTEFGLLTNLRYLNLAQNNFTGTIPSELGQLQLLGK